MNIHTWLVILSGDVSKQRSRSQPDEYDHEVDPVDVSQAELKVEQDPVAEDNCESARETEDEADQTYRDAITPRYTNKNDIGLVNSKTRESSRTASVRPTASPAPGPANVSSDISMYSHTVPIAV